MQPKKQEQFRKRTSVRVIFIYHKQPPLSRFFGQSFIRSFGFVLWFCDLAYFVSSLLDSLCQYENQTFSTNQSIITSNCRESCQCYHINDRAFMKCKPLCPIEEDPKCHRHSERLTEFGRSLNDTNCTCIKKRCVSGIKFHSILFCH